MAVYKRTYKGYAGRLTPPAWRFLVLPRYAFKQIFKSKFLLIGYVGCFFVPVILLLFLYLNQNASVLALVGQKTGFIKVNGSFFLNFLTTQGVFAGIMTAFVGPGLVAPDLTNGALSVYLSRPFSRAEYILGKGMVLGSLIASITLIPGLILFGVQSELLGYKWFEDNLYLGTGVAVTGFTLILVFVLLGLAMSAFVRWRIVAGALVLAVFAAGKGFGAVINNVMRTENGLYLDLQHLISTVASDWLRQSKEDDPISGNAAALALALFCLGLLALINRKLRVCEVAS